jgi:D-alanyl-D-alanine dipeptidase
MKLHFLCICIVILNIALAGAAQPVQRRVLPSSTQFVVVATRDWNAVEGVLLRYERANGNKGWKLAGDAIPVVVGKNGMGWGTGVLPTDSPAARTLLDPVKKEGGARSPAGIFWLSTAFGYDPRQRQGWKMPYIVLTPSVECVDDSASRFYNRVLDRRTVAPDWHSSEHMLRSDEAYRLGIAVDHNANPPVPAGGSCIFMHIWSGLGQGTTGCTAMPQEKIEALLAWLDPARNPMLVQLPLVQYKKQRKNWRLPKLPKSLDSRAEF